LLEGIWVPIVTPFIHDQIMWNIYEQHLNHLLKKRIQGIVVGGSTGEGIKLLDYEMKELIAMTSQAAANSGKKVIVGIAPSSTRQALHSIELFSSPSVAAFLVLTPFYFPLSDNQIELIDFYLQIAEFSEIPVIIYNMPRFTHFEINPDVVTELSVHPNILGIKYSGNQLKFLLQLTKRVHNGFKVISGNGTIFPDFFKEGGDSAILAIANILPESCVDIYKNRMNIDRHREEIEFVTDSNTLIVNQHGIEGIKYILSKILNQNMDLRSPYRRLEPEAIHKLDEWYKKHMHEIQ
jgi:4-hydroxy-2-oxoglutarate aldolase